MLNIKNQFPILSQKIHGKPLVFLDSAASSQKPQCVIDAISHYYQNDHANIHRGVYELSLRATEQYENTRHKIKNFINAEKDCEIIFTKGTTEAINLVANTFGRKFIKENDEIIISEMEHHSNIVPWQMVCEAQGAVLKVTPVLENGELDLDAYKKLFSEKTKMVAIAHASNVLGTINPLKEIIRIAHEKNVPVLVDGAQAFPHMPVDVKALDCDFYAFSSHKAYGPTGVGVLYGKQKWLDQLPPYQGGGDMIERVTFAKTTYQGLPQKFEAGTPNIADIIGFSAALDFLNNVGMENILAHEKQLLTYAMKLLSNIPGIRFIGTAKEKVGVISFLLENIHAHDLATVLDREGIAVRAGHHCAMPLMDKFNVPACTRASFGMYTTEEDIIKLVQGIETTMRLMA